MRQAGRSGSGPVCMGAASYAALAARRRQSYTVACIGGGARRQRQVRNKKCQAVTLLPPASCRSCLRAAGAKQREADCEIMLILLKFWGTGRIGNKIATTTRAGHIP